MIKRLLKKHVVGAGALTLALEATSILACVWESGFTGWLGRALRPGREISLASDPIGTPTLVASLDSSAGSLPEGVLYLLAAVLLMVWVRHLVGFAFARYEARERG